ncbi:hypothetical protein QBC39DRAFT_39499 [Podospora conica]|nr:hypothetical protein QBC39DRAFT_39499 [Schizothecium conicum]
MVNKTYQVCDAWSRGSEYQPSIRSITCKRQVQGGFTVRMASMTTSSLKQPDLSTLSKTRPFPSNLSRQVGHGVMQSHGSPRLKTHKPHFLHLPSPQPPSHEITSTPLHHHLLNHNHHHHPHQKDGHHHSQHHPRPLAGQGLPHHPPSPPHPPDHGLRRDRRLEGRPPPRLPRRHHDAPLRHHRSRVPPPRRARPGPAEPQRRALRLRDPRRPEPQRAGQAVPRRPYRRPGAEENSQQPRQDHRPQVYPRQRPRGAAPLGTRALSPGGQDRHAAGGRLQRRDDGGGCPVGGRRRRYHHGRLRGEGQEGSGGQGAPRVSARAAHVSGWGLVLS